MIKIKIVLCLVLSILSSCTIRTPEEQAFFKKHELNYSGTTGSMLKDYKDGFWAMEQIDESELYVIYHLHNSKLDKPSPILLIEIGTLAEHNLPDILGVPITFLLVQKDIMSIIKNGLPKSKVLKLIKLTKDNLERRKPLKTGILRHYYTINLKEVFPVEDDSEVEIPDHAENFESIPDGRIDENNVELLERFSP